MGKPEGMGSGKRWVLGMRASQRDFSWGWLLQITAPLLGTCKNRQNHGGKDVATQWNLLPLLPAGVLGGAMGDGVGGQLEKGVPRKM